MAVKRWVWVVVGLSAVAVIGFVGFVAATVFVVVRHVDVEDTNRPAAEREFDQVRARFAGRAPLIEIEGLDLKARPPAVEQGQPKSRLEALHVVVWDSREDRLVRATIPFWVVRLSGWKPIDFRSDEIDFSRIRITPEDLERYGPGLILDHRDRRGSRVLVWAE